MVRPPVTQGEQDKRLSKQVLPWIQRGVDLIAGKLADARSHAENAVTQTLKATPDGRASTSRIRRNPSFKAALIRLDELLVEIGGPSVTSLTGLIQDVTEACYRDSMRYWQATIPEEFQVQGNVPTQAQATYVRGLLWYGKPIRQAFEVPIVRAKHDLTAALGAAGSTAATKRAGNLVLRTWETRINDRLSTDLGVAINDAAQRANLQAMKDVTDPQFLTEEAQ